MQAVLGVGSLHHVASAARREEVIRAALDAGIRAFDAAPAYGDGLGERELGRILQPSDDAHITTKFGIPVRTIGEWPVPLYLGIRAAGKVLKRSFGAQYGSRRFTKAELTASLDNSRRRLRRSHVDLFLAHEPLTIDDFRTVSELWPEMEERQRAGDLRAFGVSGTPKTMLEAEELGLIHPDAVRMIQLTDEVVALPADWFADKTVRVFSIIRHMRNAHPEGRIATQDVVRYLRERVPTCDPVFGTCNTDELARIGEAIAHTTPSENA